MLTTILITAAILAAAALVYAVESLCHDGRAEAAAEVARELAAQRRR